MHSAPLHPLQSDADLLLKHCNVSLHCGRAKLGGQPRVDLNDPILSFCKALNPKAPELSDVTFDAAFLMPAAGDCLIFLQCRSDFRLSRSWGTDLTVTGTLGEDQFTLRCSEISIKTEGEMPGGRRWAIATQVNGPAELTYGETRPVTRVQALINNFDFECGNESKESGECNILRVCAGGRIVDFVRRDAYEQVKTLLSIGALPQAPLSDFSFDAWENSTEAELADFAEKVAGLCGLVARQHTGIPVLSFLDQAGRPIKRLVKSPLTSPFRGGYLLPHLHLESGLPKIFDQCFENYRKLMESERWMVIDAYSKTVLDPPYLEQKCATVMAGIERLIRNSLIEAQCRTERDANALRIPKIFRAAQKQLGWQIPPHYSVDDRTKRLRNAVAHGGPLPLPPDQVHHDLDKWWLFLMRRVLMHLGFTGSVRSPNIKAGRWQMSQVNDFSEDHNSFGA